MDAAILAVGSELLGSMHVDTNSLALANALERYGVRVKRKSVVGDEADAIGAELEFALRDVDVVIVTGGLGPTRDDVTRQAVADALGLQLVEDPAILEDIESKFSSRGLRMPAVNERQAKVFSGHKIVRNPRGTAPGFHLNISVGQKAKHVWLFPGVPYELDGMIGNDLEPWLQKLRPELMHRRVVKLAGLTESAAEEALRPYYERHEGERVIVLAARGEIHVHLMAEGDADDAYPRLTEMEKHLRELFGDRVFGLDHETLESTVGKLLTGRGETVSTAESCTGGLLGSRITDVSGSSAYYIGGAVAYSQQAKLFLIGIDPATIEKHGEVSEEVAIEMAQGVRRRFGTTYGMGITGIAGPTGGTAAKPVGTVHVAVAGRDAFRHKRFLFTGSRELVKHYSVQVALDMLRLMILRGPAEDTSPG
jgi:nicotinamide-nucleotide amidase